MSNWTEEQYQNYINQGKGKVEAKRLANIDTINKKVDLFNNDASNKTTLFDVTEIDNTTNKYRTITLYLSGNPMPKQSYRSGVKRFKSNGIHTCPWTNKPVEHKAGDVIVYKNKKTSKVDVIPIAYQDKKYEDRIKEYRIMINNQLPKDFVMFTSEVHIIKLEFIFSPIKSFSKKILDGLQNKTLLKYHIVRPDWDNISKLALDTLNGIVYDDDSHVCKVDGLVKRYGWKSGIIIELKGF